MSEFTINEMCGWVQSAFNYCDHCCRTTRNGVCIKDEVVAVLRARSAVEDWQRRFRGVGELERSGYIPEGSAAERESPTAHTAVSREPPHCQTCSCGMEDTK